MIPAMSMLRGQRAVQVRHWRHSWTAEESRTLSDETYLQHAHDLVGSVIEGEGGRTACGAVSALVALPDVGLDPLQQLLPILRRQFRVISDQIDPPPSEIRGNFSVSYVA